MRDPDDKLTPAPAPWPKPIAEAMRRAADSDVDRTCPVCGAALVQEKRTVVCKSDACGYRVVFTLESDVKG